MDTNTATLAACALALVAIYATSAKVAVGWGNTTRAGVKPPRCDALDGFRGLLAMGVFLHHALFFWPHFLHGQGWRDPTPARLFGDSRVVLFFMMTSLIFYGRLLDSGREGVDWLRLFVSRLLRLGPVYWLAMLLMFGVVAVATIWHVDGAGTGIVQRTWSDILRSVEIWLGFSMLGMPPIDAYMNTRLIVAGVTWTLPFEWAFYFVLPALALPFRIAMPLWALVLGLGGVMWLFAWAPDPLFAGPYLGGMAAALLVRMPRLAPLLRSRPAAVFALLGMTGVMCLFQTVYAFWPMLLLALTLAIVAAGNSLFGLLTLRFARWLGTLSYGIYLLHGLVLYVVLVLVIGRDAAAELGPFQYQLLILGLTPLILAAACACRRWVEAPAMRAVPGVVALLRSYLPAMRRASARRSSTAGSAARAISSSARGTVAE